MKRQKWLCIIGVLFVFLGTETMAKNQTITRDVGNINSVTLKCTGTLHITQGNTRSLRIETDDETFKKIVIRENGKELYLEMKNEEWFKKIWQTRFPRIDFYLTIKELEKVENGGCGCVIFENTINTKKLELAISGCGDVSAGDIISEDIDCNITGNGKIRCNGLKLKNNFSMNISGTGNVAINSLSTKQVNIIIAGSGMIKIKSIKVETITSKLSGVGNMILSGSGITQRVSVSGTCNYEGQNFQTDYADISADGVANIKVNASKSVNISRSGIANIDIYGKPEIKNIKDNSSNIKLHNIY